MRQAAALVKSLREETGHPIFLNGDHTHSLEKAEEAAPAGFDEIIFDGSGMPFEENIAQTAKAVAAISSINPSIVVEGEVGYIGTSSEILSKAPEG
ncbi:MAG TPA: class II fructose-bisphosphate aldolase, partial [Candidatus Binataceae bacterium]